ncbi:MAG: BsaA family SipW-dependent biofilm matrix protein [Oscillospiraceae bacterium]
MQKDKPRSKKKLALAVTAVLMAAILLSATYAWLSAKDEVTNRLETINVTDGSVIIEETFTPPTDWKPGQKITKEVAVSNVGDLPVFVRVHFEEAMQVLGERKMNANSTDPTVEIPQYMNIDAYTKSGSGYGNLPAGMSLVDGNGDPYSFPSDVKLLVKTATEAGRTSYSFVLYRELSGGKYQKMSATFAVNEKKVAVTDVMYCGFAKPTEVKKDWSLASDKPAANKIGHPVTDTDEKIDLTYSADLATPAAKSKWYYNEADGYFYYLEVLAPKTISPDLLKSLSLKADADEKYIGMIFNLTVKMDAIQMLDEALKDATGWNLSPSGDVYPILKNIIDTYTTP